MVAQYENLRDMIFDLNTSFDINTAVETLERKVFSIMDKTYWQEKLWAHLTLNDISSQNEVRVSRYLTLKNNKITVEEEQQDIDKLEKLCSERKACRQKWLTTLCLSDRQMCIIGYICWATGIELYRNDFATTTQLQVACHEFFNSNVSEIWPNETASDSRKTGVTKKNISRTKRHIVKL